MKLPEMDSVLPSGGSDWIEILLMWVIFYHLLKLLRGTRGAQVLSGLAFSLVSVFALTYFLQLHTLNFLFTKFSVNLVLAFVIIFQPEIRKALKKGGNTQFEIHELPDLNHLFQTSKTGLPSEYRLIEETFSPVALEIISSWIITSTK